MKNVEKKFLIQQNSVHTVEHLSYANLNTSYWQSHFYAYGKLF